MIWIQRDSVTQRDGQHELEAVVVRTLTWRLVPFLFLLYIVAHLDRINLGFAALQTLNTTTS